MRNQFLAFIGGFALLMAPLAFAAHAQAQGSQVKVEPAAQQKPAKPKLICRAPIDNGMLLTRAKQCYTKAEWEARRKRMQKSVSDIQMRTMQTFHH